MNKIWSTDYKKVFNMEITKVTWKEEFSVGLTTVDDQHKRFLVIINELGDFIENHTFKENGNRIYFSLIHFADTYLMKEKMLVNSIENIDYSYFREKHSKFIKKLQHFKDEYNTSASEQLCVELYQYLIELYPEYISHYTPSLVNILKEHNVK